MELTFLEGHAKGEGLMQFRRGERVFSALLPTGHGEQPDSLSLPWLLTGSVCTFDLVMRLSVSAWFAAFLGNEGGA